VSQTFWATLGRIRLPAPASCVAYGPGNRWAVAGVRNDVHILDMKAGARARRFRQHDAPVSSVAISPDGRLVLSGDEAGDLMCWDLETLQIEHSLEAHEGIVLSLAFLPSGIYVLTGGVDGGPRLRELTFGKECHLVDSAWDEDVTAVAASRDGRWILAGGSAGRVQLWEVQSGECYQECPCGEEAIASVGFSAEGKTVTAAARSPGGRTAHHPNVWRWETATGKPLPVFDKAGRPEARPNCVSLDQEGKRFLVAGRYSAPLASLSRTIHALEVWSTTTGVCQCAYSNVAGEITALAVSPDNTRILAALADRQVQVFAMMA
jgi:WD40 repeat protein